MEDEDTSRSTGAAQGFVSGNETNYNYSDDVVVHSEWEAAIFASGW